MPVLAFFAVVGSVLVAMLFVADATLEENGAPVIVTSQRTGLPAPRYNNANAIKTLTNLPAPEPDMTSRAVLTAQPKSAPNALPKIAFEAREARAEVPPKNARVEASGKHALAEAPPQIQRVAQPTDSQQKIESERREAPPPENYQQNQFDRFSIKGY
jgi:hypothetical protein